MHRLIRRRHTALGDFADVQGASDEHTYVRSEQCDKFFTWVDLHLIQEQRLMITLVDLGKSASLNKAEFVLIENRDLFHLV